LEIKNIERKDINGNINFEVMIIQKIFLILFFLNQLQFIYLFLIIIGIYSELTNQKQILNFSCLVRDWVLYYFLIWQSFLIENNFKLYLKKISQNFNNFIRFERFMKFLLYILLLVYISIFCFLLNNSYNNYLFKNLEDIKQRELEKSKHIHMDGGIGLFLTKSFRFGLF